MNVVSRIVMGFMGLVFFGAGLFTLWAIGHMVYDGASTYFWEPAPCTVESSEVVPSEYDSDHVFRVTYRWRWQGREYSGDRLWPHYDSSSLTDANNLSVSYPPGRRVTCYVDPEDPAEATLERPAPWRALILLVPFPFIGVGVLLGWLLWPRGERAAAPAISRAAPKPGKRGKGFAFAMLFCGTFVVVGLALFIPYFLLPGFQLIESRDWQQVPATVVSSDVRAHSGDDSTTYSVDILYRYRAGGREFHSDRYQFLEGSSSGYQGKAEIVARYAEGSEVTAWVDPENPGSAVLTRDLSAGWLIALLPLLFVVVGLGGMFLVWKGSRVMEGRGAVEIESWKPLRLGADDGDGVGGQVLEAEYSPLGKLALAVFIALVWNGVTGVFVALWWGEHQAGTTDGCLTLFLIPFVLVGILLLVSVPYQFLASFNPRPVLRIDRRLEPGTEATVNWHFKGAARRVRRVRVTVVGAEEATYRQGTNTRTASETFHHQTVEDSEMEAQRGSAPLSIPEGTMHSFEASNNKVAWSLVFHGEIRYWPDVNETFPLVVHPREVD